MDIEKLENCPSCKKDLGQGEYDGQYCNSCNTSMGFAALQTAPTAVDLDGLKQLLKDEGYYSPDGFGMLNHLAATGRLKV